MEMVTKKPESGENDFTILKLNGRKSISFFKITLELGRRKG